MMRLSHIIERGEKRKGLRLWFYVRLPLNTICWLFGHKAAVSIQSDDPAKPYLTPWRLVECKVCGRRYQGEGRHDDVNTVLHQAREMFGRGWDASFTARELHEAQSAYFKDMQQRQVAYARTNPREVAESCSGREGYEDRQTVAHLEVWFRKIKLRSLLDHLSFRLHVGTRWSETPWDGHLDLGWVAVYWGVGNFFERFAHWLGRGHKRDIKLSVHGGRLWWSLWYDSDGGNDSYHKCDSWRPAWWSSKKKHRSWRCLRDGNIDLNPIDVLWGSPKYERTEVGSPRTALVVVGQFPHDEYLVDFQLEHSVVRRADGPRWARRIKRTGFAYDAKCRPGIPVRNHEWKGDEILGWGGNLGEWTMSGAGNNGRDWLPLAVTDTIAHVERDRRHYDYRPPKEAVV